VLRYSEDDVGGKLATLNVDGSKFCPFFEGGEREPAQLIFDEDATGEPRTGGFVECDGQRLTLDGIT
jgi:hypothetical protein